MGQGRSGFNIHIHWLRQAQKQYEIVAVADHIPGRCDESVKEFGCKAYKDYRDMLKDKNVELFVNALPSVLHPQGTIDAFKSGRHVLSEKPLAAKVKDFDRMVEAANKAKKKLFPFQNSRFYPFFQKMLEIIDSGVLGEIVHIRSSWSGFQRRNDWQTRQELLGGNLLNTGPHPMDHAIVLFGKRKPSVFCQMKAINTAGDANDFCAVTLYGKNAPVIEVLLSSYQAYPQGEQYCVSGTLGGLTGGPAGLKWKYFDPKKHPKPKLMPGWSEDRGYCAEKINWVEKSWEQKGDASDFSPNSRGVYDNMYDVLVNKGKRIIQLDEVRRQIEVMEECHRQNRLPRKTKFTKKL